MLLLHHTAVSNQKINRLSPHIRHMALLDCHNVMKLHLKQKNAVISKAHESPTTRSLALLLQSNQI